MGAVTSKSSDSTSHGGDERDEDEAGGGGGQLYVSLRMENYTLKGDLLPHVFGSAPIVGSWDSSRAVCIHFLSLLFLIYLSFDYSFVMVNLICFISCHWSANRLQYGH